MIPGAVVMLFAVHGVFAVASGDDGLLPLWLVGAAIGLVIRASIRTVPFRYR